MNPELLLDGKVSLYCGDCISVMETLPENSIDAIVTDPPYHLTSIVKRFGASDAAPSKPGKTGAYARASRGFMGRTWDGVEIPKLEAGLGHWLAGFADGEGCFTTRKVGAGFVCEFIIHVRADDAAILRAVHTATEIGDIDGPRVRADGGSPMIKWIVRRQVDCAKLVQIFRAFPLRAKKARDFEIWASAVDEWIKHEPETSWEDIRSHAEMLSAVKMYGSSFHPSQLFHYRWARQAFRILKPGGHIMAFCGTRMYHRLGSAIEDAGFEVRDMLSWLYGSGFPKSHNVSKAIDETMFRRWLDADSERRAAYDSEMHAAKSIKRAEARATMVDKVETRWREVAGCARDKIRIPATSRIGSTNTMGGDIKGDSRPWIELAKERGYHELDGDTPATDEARAAEGWGTAFKPALEPICFARKPLIGTVAENFMEHGTGAIHIDACRVGSTGGSVTIQGDRQNTTVHAYGDGLGAQGGVINRPDGLGRWPANVLHDGSPEVVDSFPLAPDKEGEAVSAARFFYTAKADVNERLGSKHPTVKPTDLMQWLVRSVTPKGGTVLDCFAGTGTTGEAAWREGMRAILIEREPEYQNDIRRRMSLVLGGPEERHRVAMKPREKSVDDLPLFGGEGVKHGGGVNTADINQNSSSVRRSNRTIGPIGLKR